MVYEGVLGVLGGGFGGFGRGSGGVERAWGFREFRLQDLWSFSLGSCLLCSLFSSSRPELSKKRPAR